MFYKVYNTFEHLYFHDAQITIKFSPLYLVLYKYSADDCVQFVEQFFHLLCGYGNDIVFALCRRHISNRL